MSDGEQGTIDELRREVALGGHVLNAAGLSEYVWGHVSARDPEHRGVWMKASGLGFEEVTESSVLLVDPDGNVLAGDGPRHSEYPIHVEILRARLDAQSVVHIHPPHAIALAASGRPLQAFSHAGGVFSAGVRRYDDAPGLVDTTESGEELARALGGDRALLLTGHGIVTVGASVATAVAAAVMLEQACRLQLLAEGFGGVAAPKSPDEAARDYAHTLRDEHLMQAWRYLVRRVQARAAP
ncbi:MAG: class II aldolase/adducin family protein [Solirubrobacteraceae bacterium]